MSDVPTTQLIHESGLVSRLAAVFLTTEDKSEAIRLMAEQAERLSGRVAAADIVDLVEEREEIATSMVSEEIAFPHAVRSGIADSAIVVGVTSTPLAWDPPNRSVRVIALFAGGEKHHLEAMSGLARVFRDEEVVRRVVHAQSPRLVLEIIADRHRAHSRQPSRLPEHGCNRALLDAADRARHNLPGCAVGLFSDVFDPSDEAGRLSEIVSGFDGFLFTRSMTHPELEVQDVTWVHGVEMPAGSRARLESEITRAAVRGAFTNVETVVVLSGDQGSNLLTELHVVSVAPHPGESDELIPGLHHAVSERVIQLARELGSEGREGKPVGCLFVMATPSAVQSYTHQLIVNPFLGYPEEQRNILDPSLAETIKEFAKIDGAFVIRPDGTVMSAGTYLAVSPEQLEHHPGEGARHASARAISAVAPAVAVTVSESTGRTSVYVGGRRRM